MLLLFGGKDSISEKSRELLLMMSFIILPALLWKFCWVRLGVVATLLTSEFLLDKHVSPSSNLRIKCVL